MKVKVVGKKKAIKITKGSTALKREILLAVKSNRRRKKKKGSGLSKQSCEG